MNDRKQWRQWKTKAVMKGIVIVLICTGFLCFSVLAEEESGPTSNVWLDVIQMPTQAQISVTVPLSYGFAVIGSVNSNDKNPVSKENGNLLLPNVRVVVTTPSGTSGVNAEYAIQTVSGSSIPIRNYSTDVRDEYADEELPPREGLPVEVKPYMVAFQDSSGPTHHWQPASADPTWDGTAGTEDAAKLNFKKFQMLLDNLAFSVAGQKSIDSTVKDVFWLEDFITLDAPPNVADYGYTSAGTAQVPSEKYISVQVRVGGIQNQYKQVEDSVKVGAIYWEVIPGELPAVTEP